MLESPSRIHDDGTLVVNKTRDGADCTQRMGACPIAGERFAVRS
jgi:hypothetical protein